jgi:hypothetical protein
MKKCLVEMDDKSSCFTRAVDGRMEDDEYYCNKDAPYENPHYLTEDGPYNYVHWLCAEHYDDVISDDGSAPEYDPEEDFEDEEEYEEDGGYDGDEEEL